MPQRQHIISRWLLDRFARDASGGRTISVFDKTTAATRDDVPTRFMTVVDDHSDDIEAALGRLENSAAPAAARLAGRAANVAPGVWPLAGTTDNLAGDGELHELPDRQTAEMRLFTFDRWLAEPPIQDRQAISAFLALMYTRSRKTERMILAAREEVMQAYADTVNALMPALLERTLAAIDAESDGARFIGLRTPDWATAFARMPWYVIRAPDDAPFVLGDSPVVATIQIGFEADGWRPMLSDATYAVCMPLAASTCLVVAPGKIVPIGVESPHEMADSINRLTWRWADRYVVSSSHEALERVRTTMPIGMETTTLAIDVQPGDAYNRALIEARRHVEAEIVALRHRGIVLRGSLPHGDQ
jgi:hypothetical protein